MRTSGVKAPAIRSSWMRRWIALAHATAASGESKRTRKPSPWVPTSAPSWSVRQARTIERWLPRISIHESSPRVSVRSVLPAMSVNITATHCRPDGAGGLVARPAATRLPSESTRSIATARRFPADLLARAWHRRRGRGRKLVALGVADLAGVGLDVATVVGAPAERDGAHPDPDVERECRRPRRGDDPGPEAVLQRLDGVFAYDAQLLGRAGHDQPDAEKERVDHRVHDGVNGDPPHRPPAYACGDPPFCE